MIHTLGSICSYISTNYYCGYAPYLRAALSQEERNALDVARDEENFRNGLKRNIAQLSNLARVNKEELNTLREQVQRVRSSCFSNGRIPVRGLGCRCKILLVCPPLSRPIYMYVHTAGDFQSYYCTENRVDEE